jgi:hypothetical protein
VISFYTPAGEMATFTIAHISLSEAATTAPST